MRRRDPEAAWPVCGTRMVRELIRPALYSGCQCCDLGLSVGAGEGNRTLMTSLEGWGSAIELRPRTRRETNFAAGEHRQRTGNRAVRPNCGPFALSPERRERAGGSRYVRGGRLRIGQRDVAQLG